LSARTQLETDRRLLGERVRVLSKRLEKLQLQRETGRQRRVEIPIPSVALVGYTNAGKSTLFRSLTGADAYVADQLFATLDPLVRKVELPGGTPVVLADTVGFIRELPHELVAAFRSTLTEAREATLLLHVIDASDPYVMNKMDAVPADEATAVRERVANLMPNSLFVSALAPGGLDTLKASLLSSLRTLRPVLEVQIPAANGRLIAEVHRDGEVLDQQVDDDVIVLRARLDERTIGRLRQAGARVKVVQGGSRPQPGSRNAAAVPLP